MESAAASTAVAWIGRCHVREDRVTERLLAEFRATLAGEFPDVDAPQGLHWCLSPDIAPPADLGRDGHPRPGIFLPDTGLPRRMWAGGELTIHGDFAPGDLVTRKTTVASVAAKEGRTGPLCFVGVDHAYLVGGAPVVTERHDIVYREDPRPGEAPAPRPGDDWQTVADLSVTPGSTLLFRYSALTFNGHRIHYDTDYARSVEGYAGLVVHGPLQATWMLNMARMLRPAAPMRFTYRALNPLICGLAVRVEAREAEGGIELRVRRESDGVVTMQARATTPD